jgi:hypothetical protein
MVHQTDASGQHIVLPDLKTVLGKTSIVDCSKECQLLQPPADKVGDELNQQYCTS